MRLSKFCSYMNGSVAQWQTTAQRQYHKPNGDYVYNQLQKSHSNIKGGDCTCTEPKRLTIQSCPSRGHWRTPNSEQHIMSHTSRTYMDPVQKHVVRVMTVVKPNTSECLATIMYVCAKLCVISMYTKGGRVEGGQWKGGQKKGAALMSDKEMSVREI